ncbi:tRNA lysidine(34) synthetase TilS [Lentibacter algarum]|uniref:tRNA lysidine(34) synthetase TilS n=1 Tax=Lentibacter algarum TaxID=576131 RepID=UPI001C0779B0|nr:tRNA lysidine(34) synthetase TilS [Lentibacter algarum]MBU2980970.1 tRNA lysidine(34) synthetase TilS [Lentibacter algarum]
MTGEAGPLGLAVSGGSDSLALLFLAQGWATGAGVQLYVATVDHGLREEAAQECAVVAAHCKALGLEHSILDWRWSGEGNLQAHARAGRYQALAGWAHAKGLSAVALGHTRDDVAETFLMRLERGSGVAGLARMKSRWSAHDMSWRRPLLGTARSELRHYLEARGVQWCEDKSNSDTRFGRVKTRAALDVLEGLGISRQTLADTAERLSGARAALDFLCDDIGRKAAKLDGPDVVFNTKDLSAAPEETCQQLLSQVLAWVGQTQYPPRRQATVTALSEAKAATLNGCLLTRTADKLRITRELSAVSDQRVPSHGLWDGRFKFHGEHSKELTLGALGSAGLAACDDWRATGLPRSSLLASPALWRGSDLVAAPFANFGSGWRTEIIAPPAFLRR